METIAITLNGQEVSGHPGMTVLELANESGVDIPTLCHDPNLEPYGACRICVVEDERTGVLLASCVTPIAAGMVINTESAKAQERRKVIIRLMLASHPDTCMVCDKGNRCELRHIASEYGVGVLGLQKIPHPAGVQDVNPFLERDLSKCILCAKCIRADQELVVEGVLDYFGRGFDSKPATLSLKPLEESECTFCGTCVALCPTGALMEKGGPYRGTSTKSVTTVCPFCGCGCGVVLEVKGDQLIHTRPDVKSPVSRGTLCMRGSYAFDSVHSPARLTNPLVRVDGDLKESTWEEALDLVAKGLIKVKEKSGAASLAVLGSARCTNEEAYLLQRLAREVLETGNIDNGSRLYSAASRLGLGWNLGLRGTTSSLSNLEHSEVILVIGANPAASAPAVGYALKRAVKRNGAKLILVDPRQTKLSRFAHIWMRPRIGTDVALLNGLARVMVTEGLADEEFVTRRTDNFDAFSQGLTIYTPEYVEHITGVPGRQLLDVARLFAGANQASIVYGTGITQYANGTDGVMALANLAMLTGNVGHGAGGIYALQKECNGIGAADMGVIPAFLPGYQSLQDPQIIQRFAHRWGMTPPSQPGLTALEMIRQASEGNIKGMYIVGEDPVHSFPSAELTVKALSSLDFLVVQDMFLTETARMAHVVLPVTSSAEKEGTFTNFEGRVQNLRRAIAPIGNSLPDWEVFLLLSRKMGRPIPYSTLQEVMDEIEEMVPLYQGIGYSDVDMKGLYGADTDKVPSGNRRLHKGQFPTGFGRFASVHYVPHAEPSPNGYPFTLLTGTTLPQFGNGSRSPRLQRHSPGSFVEISAADALTLSIETGDEVTIISRWGSISAKAMVSDEASEGFLFMPASSPARPVASLFDVVLDPKSKAPSQKACAVRLERTNGHE